MYMGSTSSNTAEADMSGEGNEALAFLNCRDWSADVLHEGGFVISNTTKGIIV
jgi:hypothetical protein